jgi:hypothetical protein
MQSIPLFVYQKQLLAITSAHLNCFVALGHKNRLSSGYFMLIHCYNPRAPIRASIGR